ncbi:MAG: PIN domain nuclease [Vicinamibacterales bacterium]
MVIVDSTVWVDYFNGIDTPETSWLDKQLDQQRLGLTTLILCEVLQGVRNDRAAATIEAELLKLEVFEAGSPDLAIEAARNYRILRARGRTVRKTIDLLIATFCLEHQHALLHNDRDFDPFEQLFGLNVVRAA